MRILTLALLVSSASAQSLVGVGASWNSAVTPAVNGLTFVARDLGTGNDLKTFSFPLISITSVQKRPFTVETSTSTGFAQELYRRGNLTFLAPATAGVAAGGTNVGFSVTGGVLFDWNLQRNGWHAVGGFQATRTTLRGYQPSLGLTFAKEF